MSTLNNITTQLDRIKTDVVTCHSNLKTNLIAKGIEVSETDKMSILIDKIPDIKRAICVTGTLYTLYSWTMGTGNYPSSLSATLYNIGEARTSVEFTCNTYGNYSATMLFEVLNKDNVVIYSKTETVYNNYTTNFTTFTYDHKIEPLCKIKITGNGSNPAIKSINVRIGGFSS